MNFHLEKFIQDSFKKPGKALDLGAGKFYDVAYFKYLGWKCEGVDLKTGINLEKKYISKLKPFDLVYSNYVFQKIKNKEIFLKTAYDNLKTGGLFFLHTFDKTDKVIKRGINKIDLKNILESAGFKEVKIKTFSLYDNSHKHWHKILEATARKT